MFEDDAAAAIGAKIIEMADRVRPVAKVTPGVEAHYSFKMDDVAYDVVVKVRSE